MQQSRVPVSRKPRILVVEDDETLGEQLSCLLERNGYVAKRQTDGRAGLSAALDEPFDAILLDVLLPTMDGFAVLKALREQRWTPVVMLTACGAEEERIRGFEGGADDYVPKPFSFTELLLRIEALLRRASPSRVHRDLDRLSIDSLVLRRSAQTAECSGNAVVLTPIQFALLWTLVAQHGELVTKPALSRAVLHRQFSPYDRSIDMHLSRVRRRLAAAGFPASRLQTVHGKGYRFL